MQGAALRALSSACSGESGEQGEAVKSTREMVPLAGTCVCLALLKKRDCLPCTFHRPHPPHQTTQNGCGRTVGRRSLLSVKGLPGRWDPWVPVTLGWCPVEAASLSPSCLAREAPLSTLQAAFWEPVLGPGFWVQVGPAQGVSCVCRAANASSKQPWVKDKSPCSLAL